MVKSACLGLPCLGENQELASAVSDFLRKKATENKTKEEDKLEDLGRNIRDYNFKLQQQNGIDIVSCNDFTFFDHILDTTTLVGNIPRRYYWKGGKIPFEIYFMMTCGQQQAKFYAQPMEIGRWFNTPHLYMMPNFSENTDFAYSDNKAILHYREGQKININSRPIFLGPVSYILLGKNSLEKANNITEILEFMMPVYEELFKNLGRLRVEQIQIDEPFLTTELSAEQRQAYVSFYTQFAKYAGDIKINLTASYGDICKNLDVALSLPIHSLHIDLCSAPRQLEQVLDNIPKGMKLSLGLIDAGNVWCNNLNESINIAGKAVGKLGSDNVIIAPSSSLFLCPLDKEREKKLQDHAAFPYLSFTKQKLRELSIITDVINGKDDMQTALRENQELTEKLQQHMKGVQDKLLNMGNAYKQQAQNRPMRQSPFNVRKGLQQEILKLPKLPLTLHGALPIELVQSKEDENAFKTAMQDAITWQEQCPIDVITYGEFERTNNIEHFARYLDEIISTEHAYVRYWGHQNIRLPIVWDVPSLNGDPYIAWAKMALEMATKPLKISIMGAISFVNSCFIHHELDLSSLVAVCSNIVMEEAIKLEELGIKIIHINEHSMLQRIAHPGKQYGVWIKAIIELFKLSCYKLKDTTQLQVSIEYSPFEDTIEDLYKLDADVLLLENARSQTTLRQGRIIDALNSYKYLNDIGIGIFDHSSDRIPNKVEIISAINKTLRTVEANRLWIVPDGSFRYKGWEECKKIMEIIGAATVSVRKEHYDNPDEKKKTTNQT